MDWSHGSLLAVSVTIEGTASFLPVPVFEKRARDGGPVKGNHPAMHY